VLETNLSGLTHHDEVVDSTEGVGPQRDGQTPELVIDRSRIFHAEQKEES